ncbi:MAG TPA: homoserine O-succinyltransferase [Geminicoccaceae bacterium]|nr:homoserine O-succinyltransferase [Geminicoccaceae bacterium]
MPIKIPNDLPAAAMLRAEGVRLIGEQEALRQDIRPLQIALLNLMPEKPKTETQLARLLGATPLQVELTLLTTSTYRPNTVPLSHLQSFYRTWEEVRGRKFDGLIVTGAPVEMMPFDQVRYWEELAAIFEWSQTHIHSTFNICWGAQAALHHFHGVPKHTLPRKCFGVYPHYVIERRDAARPPLMRGLDDVFLVPVSRHTEVRVEDLPKESGLQVLAVSDQAGLCLLQDEARRQVFMFNHLEYDTLTLDDEYRRDLGKRDDVALPENYYPHDDPERTPRNRWRAYAHLLFGNWINEMYQTTPYELGRIGTLAAG